MINYCDFGHQTKNEIRRLPTSGDAAMLVCRLHHQHEMKYRAENHPNDPRPEWSDLEVVQEDAH